MKKIKLFVVAFMAIGVFCFMDSLRVKEKDLVARNIEALSSAELGPCNYSNGYKAFSGKRGGAYDCCRVWMNNAPRISQVCK